MKSLNKYLVLIMALLMCLAITACGNDDSSDDDYRAPAVIEDAAYDSAAAYDSSYNEYLGLWAASDSDVCDALEVEAIDSGLYFTLYNGYDIVAAGNAQNVTEYAYIYFFNENDGKAYQVSGGTDGMTIESFGTFCHGHSRSQDRRIFCRHCKHLVSQRLSLLHQLHIYR